MRFAARFTALLIALIFLGASAQCISVCTKADSADRHMPPCHQKHASCTKLLVTADRAVPPATPVPTLAFLPLLFAPVFLVRDLPVNGNLASLPGLAARRTTVLLI